jgi:DnaK suppressor protein
MMKGSDRWEVSGMATKKKSKAVKSAKLTKTAVKTGRSAGAKVKAKTTVLSKAKPKPKAKSKMKTVIKMTRKTKTATTVRARPETTKRPLAKSKPTPSTGKVQKMGSAGKKAVMKPAVKATPAMKATPAQKSTLSSARTTEKAVVIVEKGSEKGAVAEAQRKVSDKKREEDLRRVLLEKKEELWLDVKDRLFNQMGKEHREEVDSGLDDGDRAMADLAAETGISLLDMRSDVLEKIDRALLKLDEGTYGICEDCGEEIQENRLKAVPFAIYCVPCKSKREEMESIARETDRFAASGPDDYE